MQLEGEILRLGRRGDGQGSDGDERCLAQTWVHHLASQRGWTVPMILLERSAKAGTQSS